MREWIDLLTPFWQKRKNILFLSLGESTSVGKCTLSLHKVGGCKPRSHPKACFEVSTLHHITCNHIFSHNKKITFCSLMEMNFISLNSWYYLNILLWYYEYNATRILCIPLQQWQADCVASLSIEQVAPSVKLLNHCTKKPRWQGCVRTIGSKITSALIGCYLVLVGRWV